MKNFTLTQLRRKAVSGLYLASLAFVVLLFPFSAIAQDDFSNINAFLKSTLRGDGRLSVKTIGDLNGDGLKDWAGVIRRQPQDESPTYQLFVLLRLRKGGYHLAVNSIEEEIPGMGCCWLESLVIRNSSIYVQNNAKTVSVMEEVTHQFKFHNGEWRLVGIRINLTDYTPGAQATTDTDMNLLTGLVNEKEKKGRNKPVLKSRRIKPVTYLLKDFDFSTGFGNEQS